MQLECPTFVSKQALAMALAHGCRRAAMTPLGFPVVPEVKKPYAKVWPAP